MENNQFTRLPFTALVSLKSSLESLSLDRNNIEDVGEDNFAQFRQLKELNLADNLLSRIQPGAFRGLISLQIL